jgi:hypothetical protein
MQKNSPLIIGLTIQQTISPLEMNLSPCVIETNLGLMVCLNNVAL